jgi:hypothetical protein
VEDPEAIQSTLRTKSLLYSYESNMFQTQYHNGTADRECSCSFPLVAVGELLFDYLIYNVREGADVLSIHVSERIFIELYSVILAERKAL